MTLPHRPLAILVIGCGLAGACLPASGEEQPATSSSRQNVLFLAVDDMNDWVGHLGGCPGTVHTPHIDRLARRGTAFTNAHTAAPVCCPSRAAVMSGLLPTTSGIYSNQHWWKPNRPDLLTLPVHFRRNGYRAVGAGKIFHHTAGNNPPGQWDDYQRLVFNDNAWIRSAPNYPWTEPAPTPAEFPYCGMELYSEECDWGVLPLEESRYDDFVTASYAVAFLRSWARGSADGADEAAPQPFFLACGIFHPHLPWYVPQEYLDLYPLEKVVVPEYGPDDLDDVPEPGRKLALRKSDDLEMIRERGQWPAAVRHYLASISFADAQVGRVLDALDRSAAANNTIVVLWSDHGWHLGEKGHWHKRTLWEEATRVPCIVAAPGVGSPGQRCAAPASLIDLFPTLVELCPLSAVDGLDGISLVPWLRDPSLERKQPAVIIEETGHIAVRTARYRYIRYKQGEEELYDHRNDPGERTNLAGRAGHAALKKELARWIPADPARPALSKKSFDFDPQTFTWTRKKTGEVISGN
jgi:choline-sulfatase